MQTVRKVRARPARLVLAIVAAIVLGVLLLIQAASSVATRKQPEIAAQLMPLNGLALEQLAMRQFQSAVTTHEDIAPAAASAKSTALEAYRRDPLSPKSLAIIALAQNDADARTAILERANQLNRRDLLLQGMILEEKIGHRDFSGALDTLDNILRVHPDQSTTFFPILVDALKDDGAAEQLGAILDLNSPWHAQFLTSAAADREALPNLAKLRLGRDDIDPEVDRQLIRGLAASGRADLAFPIYVATKPASEPAGDGMHQRLGWNSDLPPFDWSLADEGGFRADYAPEESKLEIYVRSGKGGVLAERLIKAPSGHFSIMVTHSITPAAQVEDVRLQVGCPDADEPVIDQRLSVRPGRISVPAMAARCDFMKVALYARSWSGKSAIRGKIAPLEIRLR